jgi:hypothetical protein
MPDFDSEKNSELGRKLSIDRTEYFVKIKSYILMKWL